MLQLDIREVIQPPKTVSNPANMPTFLLIGAGKSGTTSIYNYLKQHPDIYMPRIKEPLFFAFEGQHVNFCGPGDAEINARAVTTLQRYQDLFQEGAGHKALGEASVAYLYYPSAAERIRRLVPEAKLIVVLRCPADRAYANYLHALRLGREPLGSFADALDAEPARIAAGWSHFYHYASKGWYHRQLSHWLKLFPREQILFNLYDDLEQNPAQLMRRIFTFIGVDPNHAISTQKKFNVSGQPMGIRIRNFVQRGSPMAQIVLPKQMRTTLKNAILKCSLTQGYMPSAVRKELMNAYAPDISKLGDLIERDLSGWFLQRRQQY